MKRKWPEADIEITSCSILELHPHPRLSGRAKARVRVHVREMIGDRPAEHTLTLNLLVMTEPGDHAERVRELVLERTAKVLKRLAAALKSNSDQPPG